MITPVLGECVGITSDHKLTQDEKYKKSMVKGDTIISKLYLLGLNSIATSIKDIDKEIIQERNNFFINDKACCGIARLQELEVKISSHKYVFISRYCNFDKWSSAGAVSYIFLNI